MTKTGPTTLAMRFQSVGDPSYQNLAISLCSAVRMALFSSPTVIYVGLGDKEQAFAWLNQAYDERDNWLNYLKVGPRLGREIR
jgi:hypothetical protein